MILPDHKISIIGRVKGTLLDCNGDTIISFKGRNVVTLIGFALIAARMAGTSYAVPAYMALGDSGAAQDITQTALQGTEFDRQLGTISLLPGAPAGPGTGNPSDVQNNVFQLAATFGPYSSTKTLGEIGIFNASSAGTMLARFTTPQLSFTVGSTLAVTWDVHIGEL